MFYRLPGRAIGEVTRMLQKKGGLVYGGVINSKITLSGKACSVFDLGAVGGNKAKTLLPGEVAASLIWGISSIA